jgi:hypothetical protein
MSATVIGFVSTKLLGFDWVSFPQLSGAVRILASHAQGNRRGTFWPTWSSVALSFWWGLTRILLNTSTVRH